MRRERTSRLVTKKVLKTEPQMLPIVSNFMVMIKARILSNYGYLKCLCIKRGRVVPVLSVMAGVSGPKFLHNYKDVVYMILPICTWNMCILYLDHTRWMNVPAVIHDCSLLLPLQVFRVPPHTNVAQHPPKQMI